MARPVTLRILLGGQADGVDSFTELWPLINSGGVVAIGMLVLMWVVRGTLIPKRHHEELLSHMSSSYKEMRVDRDFWRTEAMDKTGHVDRAMVVAETAVAQANGPPDAV